MVCAGSPALPVLRGFAPLRAWRWLRAPYAFLDEAAARHGPSFNLRLPVVGRALLTGDPELIAATARNKDLVGGRGTRALRPVLGEDSLIVLEGEVHAAHRRCIAPAFTAEAAGVYDAATRRFGFEAVEALALGTEFSVQALMRSISLRVILRVLFGELNAHEERRAIMLTERLLDSFRHPAFLFIKVLQRDLGGLSPWGRFVNNRADLRVFIMQHIKAARRTPADDGLIGKLARVDCGLDDGALFEEAMSLLLFGHDTAAASLAWAFHHIHTHPEVLARLREEARTHDEPTPFMQACIKESQRLCPVVVHLTRVARRATELAGHPLAKNDRVLPCAYLAHRNPDVYAEPTHYRPERFIDQPEPPTWSFFPFGFGARKCVGSPLAERQMALLLWSFMRHTDLEAVGGGGFRPVRDMLLITPAGGTPMRLRERLA